MGGTRMVEEVGELELGDELPEGKLQESRGCEECEDSECSEPWEGCFGCPYIEFRVRACTKK
jgi:hypothetical protein